MERSLERVFVDYSASKLEQLAARIGDCLGQLSFDQVWARGSENENAVGNIVLHLCGNVRQWIVSGCGSAPDLRERDREFSARANAGTEELSAGIEATVSEAAKVIRGLTGPRLAESVTIQGYNLTVLEAVYHVIEHFSHHTGQVIYATKLATHRDLGFFGPQRATWP